MDIGTLTGQVSLQDQLTDKLTEASHQVLDFLKESSAELGILVGAATAASAAIIGFAISVEEASKAVVSFAKEGDKITGVEHAFDNLAKTAGTTGEELTKAFSTGLKGTVDQLTIMQSSIRLLGSGMQLTTDQAQTLGEAAKALGRATGTDAVQGLETLNNALTTGRTRQLQMQIGLIDTKGATEEFAKSLGVAADQLNSEGQLEAKRIAIFEATESWLKRIGDQQDTATGAIKRAQAAITDWLDEFYKAVSDSEDVRKAIKDLTDAFNEAFGANSQSLLDVMVSGINKFAKVVDEYGPPIIKFFSDVIEQGTHLAQAVEGTWSSIPKFFKDVAANLAGIQQSVAALQNLKALSLFIPGSPLTSLGPQAPQLPSGYGKDVNLATPLVTIDDPSKYIKTSDAIEKLAATFDGTDATKKANEIAQALALIVKEGKATPDTLARISTAVEEQAKKGATLSVTLRGISGAFDGLVKPVGDAAKEFETFSLRLSKLTDPTEVGIFDSINALQKTFIDTQAKGVSLFGANITKAFQDDSKELIKWLDSFQISTAKALAGAGKSFQQFGAAVGGVTGEVINNIGSMASAGVKAFHDFGAAGNAFDAGHLVAGIADVTSGVLALASAGIKAAEALWNKLFGTAGRKAVDDFASQHGGFDALHKQLDALGASGEQLWISLTQGVGRNNPQQAAAVIDKITKALDDAQKAADDFNKSITPVITQIGDLGGNITSSLLPALEASGKLTADNAAAIAALSQSATPSYDQLVSLQKKYNLTAAEMGSAFQTAQINAQFQSLIDDVDELARGGINVKGAMFDAKGALTGLGQAIDDDIEQAIKAGVQIPANLKDAAQALIDQNDLVDENGKKITDLSQLHFGDTLQTTLEKLNKTLELMIQNFLGVGDAVNKIPSRKVINVDYNVNGATGDNANVPGVDTGGGGTAVIELDSNTLAEAMVPKIPGVVQRYGVG